MLARSPRVPVQWPSEMSLGDSASSVDGGDASVPVSFSVYAASEQGHLSLMTSYLAGGGNVNKRSKVRGCRCTPGAAVVSLSSFGASRAAALFGSLNMTMARPNRFLSGLFFCSL